MNQNFFLGKFKNIRAHGNPAKTLLPYYNRYIKSQKIWMKSYNEIKFWVFMSDLKLILEHDISTLVQKRASIFKYY